MPGSLLAHQDQVVLLLQFRPHALHDGLLGFRDRVLRVGVLLQAVAVLEDAHVLLVGLQPVHVLVGLLAESFQHARRKRRRRDDLRTIRLNAPDADAYFFDAVGIFTDQVILQQCGAKGLQATCRQQHDPRVVQGIPEIKLVRCVHEAADDTSFMPSDKWKR